MDNLTFALHPQGDIAMYEQLYRQIVAEMMQGRLRSGMRMPSRRALSRHLGISEQTVNTAFDLLISEGYLRAEPRRGLFVEELLPLSQPTAQKEEMETKPLAEPAFDFSPQGADIHLFPYKTWARLIRETLYTQPELLSKGEAKGEFSLRASLCSFLYQYRGVQSRARDMVIGSGVDHLLGVLSAILPTNSIIACEDPGYREAARAFERAGHTALPIGMDEQGVSADSLEECIADLAYLTPAHQFPLGLSMPAGRRTELLHWAEEKDGRFLIEDDYDSEFRYLSRPLPALKGMGDGNRTVYIGTFSRSLAPGIRIAYMILPGELTGRYESAGLRSGDAVSRFEQRAMARFVGEGHYAHHLRRAGNVYLKRCRSLCGLLAEIPGSFIKGQEAGLHFLFGIHGKSEEELIIKAEQAAIPLKGLSSYCRLSRLEAALVLGFAGIREDQVPPAVSALRTAWAI
jgi:GntR family transcriptional regulator/MocR family aminotransferase